MQARLNGGAARPQAGSQRAARSYRNKQLEVAPLSGEIHRTMNPRPIVATLACLFGFALHAQTPAPKNPTAPPVVSPEILPDGHVTFRLRAPNAKAVSVSGQFQKGPAPMTKDDAGLWSVTVGPVASDIYEYSFTVDGI